MNSTLDTVQTFRPKLTIHPSALAAKVAAWNACHEFIREHTPQALNLALAFMGEKIILATGGFSKKFINAIPDIFKENNLEYRVWLSSTNYNLILNVHCDGHFQKGAGPGGYTTSHRAERIVYLADLTGASVISKLYDFKPENWPLYTEAGVIEARKGVESAKRRLSEANSTLGPFGEWD